MNVIDECRRVFDIEIEALQQVRDSFGLELDEIVQVMHRCSGKIILCGMGKPGHIGRKISATMSSLGTPSYFLHPAEALHGDLGMLRDDDVIVIISNSGESAEICNILPNIRMIGTKIIAITSNPSSTLAQYADYRLILPVLKEACPMDLAPTSTTTAELVVGDALAITLSKIIGFKKDNYAIYHPGGALGKKLIVKVRDVMKIDENNALICSGSTLKQAITELSKKGLGAVSIVDDTDTLLGLITDGDIKRYMEQEVDIYTCIADDIMTKNPIVVRPEALAIDALKIMVDRAKPLSILPVVDGARKCIGTVRSADILQQGIVY